MERMCRAALRITISSNTASPRLSSLDISINQTDFHSACNSASDDPAAAAEQLVHLAGARNPTVLCELAYLCLTAPIGRVGTRSSLRSVAIILLDQVIADFPKYSRAYCVKGQALLPPEHGGWAEPTLKQDCVEIAYDLFSKAEQLQCFEGMFLKGRLLVTSTPVHNSDRMSALGFELVRRAAFEGRIAQAFVFVAANYEYPGKYAPSLFTSLAELGEMERQKVIFDLYNRAAQLGYAAALNDIGTSVELAYAGIAANFDQARRYYLRAAKGGYTDAFENLGNLYETGMGHKDKRRIDLRKALHFYHLGAHLRSVNCAHYLATLYDEGVQNVLKRDVRMAERLYVLSMNLANDNHDEKMASAALKDLCRCYITSIKTSVPESVECRRAMARMNELLGEKSVKQMLLVVEKSIVRALKERRKAPLEKLVHSRNSGRILRTARDVLRGTRAGNLKVREKRLVHLFGRHNARTMADYGVSKSRRFRAQSLSKLKGERECADVVC